MIPLITARVYRGRIQYAVTAGDQRSVIEIAQAAAHIFRDRDVPCDIDYYFSAAVVTPRNDLLPSRLSDIRQARLTAGDAQ